MPRQNPEITLYIPCNNEHGRSKGYATHANVEIEGDRVLRTEDPRWLPVLESDDDPSDVLTNCVISDLHGKPFMIFRDEHFELDSWGNWVGSMAFRSATLSHPDQLFDVLGIMIDEGWHVEEGRWKAMQHWERGFVNAEDLHPTLAGFYRRFATL